MPRAAEFKGKLGPVSFRKPRPGGEAAARKPRRRNGPDRVELTGTRHDATERLTLDTPVLSSMVTRARQAAAGRDVSDSRRA